MRTAIPVIDRKRLSNRNDTHCNGAQIVKTDFDSDSARPWVLHRASHQSPTDAGLLTTTDASECLLHLRRPAQARVPGRAFQDHFSFHGRSCRQAAGRSPGRNGANTKIHIDSSLYEVRVTTVHGDKWTGAFGLDHQPEPLEINQAVGLDEQMALSGVELGGDKEAYKAKATGNGIACGMS